MTFQVRWHAATYSGTKTVNAEDAEEAEAKVRRWVEQQQFPIGYRAVKVLGGEV